MWYLEPKREHEASVTCHLSKSQGICFYAHKRSLVTKLWARRI